MTPQEEFQKMLNYAGITAWHNAGFKGQGINVMNAESAFTGHGSGTLNIIKKAAPEANFFPVPTGITTKGDKLISATAEYEPGKFMDLAQFAKENNIHIITVSRGGISDSCKGWNDYCKKMQDETGVVIFNAAGNEYTGNGETLTTQFPTNVSIIVGAVGLDGKRKNYSSVGKQLDFMSYSGLIGGTSAAAPFLAGMTACIFSKYGAMTPAETYKYLKSISKDLGQPGDDVYYGEGMPLLGDPNEKEGDGMITQLIPTTAKGRRPQIPMKAEYITIHSTGNPYSTAKNEAMNVINNKPSMQVSFHIVVDENEAYNVIPLNEVAWHAGDGKGPGNMKSIGIEICESGDREKTLLNALNVVREVMASQNIDHIVQHNHWSGKNCPRILRDPAYIKKNLDWNWFLAQLDGLAEAKNTLKAKAGLSDATIDYLAQYKYGKDLIIKLAKAMK